jgi:alpha/beta superfamily hydrolase
MRILFLLGWGSTPGGLKPTFLRDKGHEVANPHLPDDDFEEAVRIAQAEFDRQHPQVVVGSSRGGAVALNIDTRSIPLVLLCPAWKSWGTTTTAKPKTVILHAEADDVVPIAHSRELVHNSGLPPSALHLIGSDHRLADSEALQAMLQAIERAVCGTPT